MTSSNLIKFSGGKSIPSPEAVQEQLQYMSEDDPVVYTNPEIRLSELMAVFSEGEMGLARLYMMMYRNRFVYNLSDQKWYKFKNFTWELDESEETIDGFREMYEFLLNVLNQHLSGLQEAAKERAFKVIGSITNHNKMKKVLDQAKAGRNGLNAKGEKFNNSNRYVGAPNGIIDLYTGELLEGTPDTYISKQVGTAYDPEAPYPEKFVDRFLSEVMKYPFELAESELTDEQFEDACKQECVKVIKFLQVLFGYAFLGLCQEHILICFFGEEGRNGKGVLLRIIIKALGDYASEIQPEILLRSSSKKSSSAPSEDIMDLKGKRMVVASETNQDQFFDTSVVKRLTGGDTVVGRHNYGRVERFRPMHTIFLQSNYAPNVGAEDKAFWKRIYAVPFFRTFVDHPDPENIYQAKKDLTLEEELAAELPGILRWVIEGVQIYFAEGLNPPESILKAVKKYRKSGDLVGHFIDECCIVAEKERVKKTDFIRALNAWRKAHGYTKAITSKVITNILESKGHKEYKYNGNPSYFGLVFNGDGESYLFDETPLSGKNYVDPYTETYNKGIRQNGEKADDSFPSV